MKYRSDIDGLRALAVVPVVLFHAGFIPFSGGFVGVDVFFVISGYLITRILLDEIRQGTFSVVGFYERRARRILPALFAVILFCSVVSYIFYLPNHFLDFAKSLVATAGFSSNILFWIQSDYYFDPGSDVKPLLHSWSLAVEEQFYIGMPLLLLIIKRYIPNKLAVVLWCCTILSFVLSVYGAFHVPKATFYLLPTRAWELLLGSLAAAGYIYLPRIIWLRQLAACAGVGLIIFATFFLTEYEVFPGHNALYPCVGALLIILAGRDDVQTFVGKMLSWKPVVFIGLISYSLYLWHWPMITFLKYYNIDELSTVQQYGSVIGSFIIAALSWKYIEQPFRGKSSKFNRKKVFAYSIAGSAIIILFGLFGFIQKGIPSRFDKDVIAVASVVSGREERVERCSLSQNKHWSIDNPCVFGTPDVVPTIAVWGDSHSDMLIPMLEELATEKYKAIEQYSYLGCPPLVDTRRRGKKDSFACARFHKDVFEHLKQSDTIETVILAARWSQSIKGYTMDFGPAENNLSNRIPHYLTNMDDTITTAAEREALYKSAAQQTINGLLQAGKRVVLVYPVPEVGYDVPSTIARMVIQGKDPHTFTRPYDYYQKRHDVVFDAFGSVQHPSLLRIYPHEKLCNDEHCMVYDGKNVLYWDNNHLSLDGAFYISPLFSTFLPCLRRFFNI